MKKNATARLSDGGPGWQHTGKFDTVATLDRTDDCPYHAVANCIRAHSPPRSLPGVDTGRTATTGISWGGYTTCLVASLDRRFRAAVPVYGCGHLRDNICRLGEFERIGPEQAQQGSRLHDPGGYLPACRVPIFFVNGTNDFAYPLDSFMKSHDDVRHAPKNVRIAVNGPHGHEPGWAISEIGGFTKVELLGPPGPLVVGPPVVDDRVAAGGPIVSAAVVDATGSEPINIAAWQTVPAEVAADGSLVGPRPPA